MDDDWGVPPAGDSPEALRRVARPQAPWERAPEDAPAGLTAGSRPASPTVDAAAQRLADAHEEAQSIVRDATEQANMLAANATRVAEQIIAEAQ